MERFRKLLIILLERTHHGNSVSYACLFLYCWISVDIQISSSNFLEKGLSKDQDGKCILTQSRYSKFYKKFWQNPKPQWGPSVLLQYRVDICTGRPKKLWVWHWQLLGVKKSKLKNCLGGFVPEKISIYLGIHTILITVSKA